MSTTSAPMIRMLAVFLALLVAANLALGAISYFFPDLPIPSAMGIILAMVAAMSAGQSATKTLNRRLVFRELAVFAVLATVSSAALGIGVFWGIFAYHGVPFTLENFILAMTGDGVPAAEIRQILSWIVPIVLIIYVLITYFGATMGSRNELKLREKLAAKGR
ncbi:MAG: ABZJ_00895 family protein [Tabrizicola sp.]|jgi:hypothetical protein|nr:ABZJ_00895 family protein [Tabrizicola sp.]